MAMEVKGTVSLTPMNGARQMASNSPPANLPTLWNTAVAKAIAAIRT